MLKILINNVTFGILHCNQKCYHNFVFMSPLNFQIWVRQTGVKIEFCFDKPYHGTMWRTDIFLLFRLIFFII